MLAESVLKLAQEKRKLELLENIHSILNKEEKSCRIVEIGEGWPTLQILLLFSAIQRREWADFDRGMHTLYLLGF